MGSSIPQLMMNPCPECGACYPPGEDSCAVRFEQLLSLDHSRREPWGSRHGQAFAVFALQHPIRYSASVDRAWNALYRIYVLEEAAAHVFASIRVSGHEKIAPVMVPTRPAKALSLPAVTIVDLGDFDATGYATALDGWCRATLRAWGVDIPVERARARAT
jgi:uncharacterized protein DUF5946